MRPSIKVENLGKQYRIGERVAPYSTVRDAIMRAAKAPLARLRRRSAQDRMIWALKDINFEIYPGEVVGIIGSNGAGKSTLLKILSRITEPTTGSVELYGRVGSLLEVGTGFHPELTGRENTYLNGAILGMRHSEIERKFDEIVAFAEIEKFIDTPVKHYSSGMYMRLAFAVAAHLEPEILLVDEVLAVGDMAFQKKCLGKMKDVAATGRTVFFVSHNLPSIVMLCNRAILLSYGEVLKDGSAIDVTEEYLSADLDGVQMLEWNDPASAPGTERMRLRSLRALNAQGEVASAFSMDDNIYIEMTYWLLEPGLETNVGYHLYNVKGVLVYMAHDFHDKEWLDRPKSPGVYRSVCEIPGALLNEGTYTLDLVALLITNGQPDIFEKEAISFEIVDDGQSEVRGRFTGDWRGGVLRPKLTWKTTKVKELE
jgi:lipopolysaccharide transport system ATP-binding protein